MIYQIALLVTYIFGIANSYLWNKYFTFQVRQASFAEVLRFISVYAVIYGVNILILHVCVDIMKFSAYYSGIGVLSLTTLASYFAHKKISFRYKHAPKAK